MSESAFAHAAAVLDPAIARVSGLARSPALRGASRIVLAVAASYIGVNSMNTQPTDAQAADQNLSCYVTPDNPTTGEIDCTDDAKQPETFTYKAGAPTGWYECLGSKTASYVHLSCESPDGNNSFEYTSDNGGDNTPTTPHPTPSPAPSNPSPAPTPAPQQPAHPSHPSGNGNKGHKPKHPRYTAPHKPSVDTDLNMHKSKNPVIRRGGCGVIALTDTARYFSDKPITDAEVHKQIHPWFDSNGGIHDAHDPKGPSNYMTGAAKRIASNPKYHMREFEADISKVPYYVKHGGAAILLEGTGRFSRSGSGHYMSVQKVVRRHGQNRLVDYDPNQPGYNNDGKSFTIKYMVSEGVQRRAFIFMPTAR